MLLSFPAVLYYLIVVSIRASRHAKRFKLVFPKNITFRVYQSGISGGQILSTAFWSYGIPTLLQYALKGVDEVGPDCHEYIEVAVLVPESRHFQADLILRQHITHGFNGVVVMSKPATRGGHSTLEYQNSTPMKPWGVSYKPVMFSERLMIFIFQSQLTSLPTSHVNNEKNRREVVKTISKKIHSSPKVVAKQTVTLKTRRRPKPKPSPKPKPRSKSAKLFD